MALEHLILLRHAKSSWQDGRMADHERPLNDRGRRAAKAIGGILRVKKILPATIWSSDSLRTRETVTGLGLDDDTYDVEFLDGFYHASANKILYLCAQKGEPKNGPLMLVGHNPGFEDLLFH
ncbi:MAG TPA: histidine phosphatase family protein, partial [Hellea balneolensis]|nr:histidine phosphatase family protein [Hellea balneolensis]